MRIGPKHIRLQIAAVLGMFMLACLWPVWGNSQTKIPSTFRLKPVKGSGEAIQSRITCLLQDQYGYIWIGTANGLLRFDGYDLKPYWHDRDNPNSMGDDRIQDLMEDEEGYLWICTLGGGLSRYDPFWDQFTVYQHNPEDPGSIGHNGLRQSYQDSEGRIWIAHQTGLDRMVWHKDKIRFYHYLHDPEDSTSLVKGLLSSVTEGPEGKIWVSGWSSGVCRLETDLTEINPAFEAKASFEHFPELDSLLGDKRWGIVFDLFLDQQGHLWVASSKSLTRVSTSKSAEKQVDFSFFDIGLFEEDAETRVLHTVRQDLEGRIWVVSGFGFHLFDPETEAVESFLLKELGVKSRGTNPIYDIMFGRKGSLWVGAQEGAYGLTGENPAFHTLQVKEETQPLIVSAVMRDQFGQLWMGTEVKGIGVADSNGAIYKWIEDTQKPSSELQGNFVTCLIADTTKGRDRVWVGTYGGGLNIMDVKRGPNGRVLRVENRAIYGPPFEGNLYPDRFIYSFFPQDEDTICVGSFRGVGKVSRDLSGSDLKVLYVGNHVVMDTAGTLWTGADDGVFTWPAGEDSIYPYINPFPNTPEPGKGHVTALHIDQKGRIWAGTQEGLIRLSTESEPSRIYQVKDGLSNNVIRSIEEDAKGGLWLSTRNGLSYLDPETHQIRVYTSEDCFVHKSFTLRTSFQETDGTLYFGGNEGVVRFHPDSLRQQDFTPELFLTGLELFNQPVPIGTPNEPGGFFLRGSLTGIRELSLEHRHKVITFRFSALEYHLPEQVKYAVKLEGFDPDWRYTANRQRSATYTNLDPGEYTFRVRAENREGMISPNELSILVNIAPPWYRTVWAYCLYGLLLIGGVWLTFTLRIRTIRKKLETKARIQQVKIEERERVRTESARDFHDEAGNKITRLSLYANLLKRQAGPDSEMVPMLDKMEDNIQTLSSGMRDFIWVLDPQHDSLTDLLLRLKTFADNLFHETEVKVVFTHTLPGTESISLDVKAKRHLMLIFKEAMHNVLKYAACTQLEFSATMVEDSLEIRLKDNGKGFAQADLSRINGLNNMRARAEEIGANLQIESSVGKGTEVIFSRKK